MESKHREAFTLIELLVVIGVIGVLAGILIPVLGRSRRAANRIQCVNNMRELGTGMQIYTAQTKGVLPWDGYAEGDRPNRYVGKWSDPTIWFNAALANCGMKTYCDQQLDDAAGKSVLPRSGDRGLFVCPEAGPAVAGPKDDLVVDGYFMMWGQNDAGLLERRKMYMCYGYNTQLDGGMEDRHSNFRVNILPSNIPKAAETVLLIEKLVAPGEYDPPFSSSVGQQQVSWKEFTTRHDGGGHVLFVDNHVGYFKRDDLINPPTAPYDYNQPSKVIWNPMGPSN